MWLKRIVAIVLTIMMLCMQAVSVCAEEDNTSEWYELIEEDFDFVNETE